MLDSLYPPLQGTKWVALTISDTQTLSTLLSNALDYSYINVWLSYGIDFGGTDVCNGCEVPTVLCVPSSFGALFPAGAFGVTKPVVCTKPSPTTIDIKAKPNAPVVAMFGTLGTTTTVGGSVVVPVNLRHTGSTTVTFALSTPVQSALGWTYAWQDAAGYARLPDCRAAAASF